jgi:hypothetical protein
MIFHAESLSAVSASLLPIAKHIFFSSSDIGALLDSPATWDGPYGVPPVWVVLNSGIE